MRRAQRVLRDQSIDAVYSSPRRRALESAAVLAAQRSVSVDDDLREIDFGEFEGITYDDIARCDAKRYDEWMNRPTEVVFPGGESFLAMVARVLSALGRILGAHRGGTAAIVSHGGVNRIALATALDLEPRHMFRLDQSYACINVVDHFGDERVVRVINRTV
jgi:broad specificity phosphatase PhoE